MRSESTELTAASQFTSPASARHAADVLSPATERSICSESIELTAASQLTSPEICAVACDAPAGAAGAEPPESSSIKTRNGGHRYRAMQTLPLRGLISRDYSTCALSPSFRQNEQKLVHE